MHKLTPLLSRLLQRGAAALSVGGAVVGYGSSWAWTEPLNPRGNSQQFEAISVFRRRLRHSEDLPLVGIGVQMADPTSTDALATCSDFIWYDLEHQPMSAEVLKWHIIAAHGKGCPAIVRVPGPNVVYPQAQPWGLYIKHALDCNADGVIVPQVRSADDVRSIVADCRYPTGGQRAAPYHITDPRGIEARRRRGFGPTIPMNYGRLGMVDYLQKADDNIFVGVMIETMDALENLDDICQVEGLDCLVIGANDLSGALGVPYMGDSEVVQTEVQRIISTAKKHGKAIMFSTRNPELGKRLVKQGVQILHVGSDVLAAVAYQDKLVNAIKKR